VSTHQRTGTPIELRLTPTGGSLRALPAPGGGPPAPVRSLDAAACVQRNLDHPVGRAL